MSVDQLGRNCILRVDSIITSCHRSWASLENRLGTFQMNCARTGKESAKVITKVITRRLAVSLPLFVAKGQTRHRVSVMTRLISKIGVALVLIFTAVAATGCGPVTASPTAAQL